MGVLKFILIVVLVYYFLKLLSRALLPFLLKYIVKKAEGNAFFHDMSGGNPDEKEEGEISIDYSPNEGKKKKTPDDEGEYIDFEELK